jgi:hypothetical protein
LRDECIDTHIEEIDKLDFPGYFTLSRESTLPFLRGLAPAASKKSACGKQEKGDQSRDS